MDREIHAIAKQLNLSKMTRPRNQMEELDAFVTLHGRYDPVFSYEYPPGGYTDQWRIALDEIGKRYDRKNFTHPIIRLYHDKLAELHAKCRFIDALRAQDCDLIGEMNAQLYGEVQQGLLDDALERIFRPHQVDQKALLGPVLSHPQIEKLVNEELDRI